MLVREKKRREEDFQDSLLCIDRLTHLKKRDLTTVFENHRKSRIQHCERSELRLYFEWTKVIEIAKMVYFGDF